MCSVIRRALGLGIVGLLLLSVSGSVAAPVPEGPRLAVVKFSVEPTRVELLTMDQTGALPARVAGGGLRKAPLPYPFSAPSWSPDGSLVAFSGLAGKGEGKRHVKIFVVAADGSALRAVPGTNGGYSPVFAPDGHTIVFARRRARHRPNRHGGSVVAFESTSVWMGDIAGGESHRLTPWRNGLDNFPSSFSPDGSVLAMTRVDERRTQDPEAVLLRLATGRVDLLAENGSDPAYSPDGSKIALLRRHLRRVSGRGAQNVEETTDLYVLDADRSGLRRLTNTPAKIEVSSSWDPSGERLAYTQLLGDGSEAAFLGFGSAIMQINADGTCRTSVVNGSRAAVLYGPAWQPGPGREAGRIECAS
jgi:Tol biopolymer transport system component